MQFGYILQLNKANIIVNAYVAPRLTMLIQDAYLDDLLRHKSVPRVRNALAFLMFVV
jgi:hypothetical protein